MMEYLYIIFALIALYAECSSSVNTKNLFKKIGLCFLVLGCIIQLSHHDNNFFEIGAMLYIVSDLYKKLKYGK